MSCISGDELQVWVGPTLYQQSFQFEPRAIGWGRCSVIMAMPMNVLFCPVAPNKGNPTGVPNPAGTADQAWQWTISNPVYSSSYGLNKWLTSDPKLVLGNGSAHPDWLIKNESALQNSTMTPAFMDSTWINLDPVETDSPGGTPHNLYTGDPSKEGMQRVTIARHGSASAGAAPRNRLLQAHRLPGSLSWDLPMDMRKQSKLESVVEPLLAPRLENADNSPAVIIMQDSCEMSCAL